jgi:hypothetical protein
MTPACGYGFLNLRYAGIWQIGPYLDNSYGQALCWRSGRQGDPLPLEHTALPSSPLPRMSRCAMAWTSSLSRPHSRLKRHVGRHAHARVST